MIRVVAMSACLAIASYGHALAQDAAKPDPAKGQAVAAQVCVACHMADGNSAQPENPKLAGQFSAYLYKQLMDFKAQGNAKPERENAIMAGMVANLSQDDMRDVAAFYAAQTLQPAAAQDKDLAALGQTLYRAGNPKTGVAACAGCHGPSGAGIPKQFPRISGQFAQYVESQLKAFRAGARANDPNGMMRGVAARMTDQEIKAVAEYTAGLR
ncbi:MAG: c-type cytochrome [Burkholderiales bacterium]|nr:c-type cytochrome [Burkholderiales bacterium]